MICLYKFLILYNINFYFDVCMDFVIFKNEISDVKTFERPKNIEESYDSQLRNYWNKTKYIWLNNREI